MRPLICAALFLGWIASVHADDFLAAGTYYYRAHLEDITADTVTIVHKDGRRTMLWNSLAPEVQRKYAKQHEDAIRQQALDAQAKEEAAKMEASGMRMLGGTVLSILASNAGILIAPIGSNRPVLLRGYDAKDLVDGDPVSPVMVLADGTYSYDPSRGPRVTVRAYKVAPKPVN